MIILDTNVVSELQGRKHSDHVVQWLRAFEIEELFLTAITVAEMRLGLELLAPGRRQAGLFIALDDIQSEFLGRILGFRFRLLNNTV